MRVYRLDHSGRGSVRVGAVSLLAVAVLAVMGFCVVASGAEAAEVPWWHLTSSVRPSHLSPDGEGVLSAQAVNVGDGATSGAIGFSETLPPGLSVVEAAGVPEVSFFAFSKESGKEDFGPSGSPSILGLFPAEYCKVVGVPVRVTCDTRSPVVLPPPFPSLTFELGAPTPFSVAPYEYLEMRISVKVAGDDAQGDVQASVEGGGGALSSIERSVPVSEGVPSFGVEDFRLEPEEAGGEIDARAGSHPFQLTTTFSLAQDANAATPPGLPRNLHFQLPAGLVGNATAIPQCDDLDFSHIKEGGVTNLCPEDTAIGVAIVTLYEPVNIGLASYPVPLFNLVPEVGEPARFGFELFGSPVTLDTAVRTGQDYGVTVNASNITQLVNFISTTVSFWGVPGESVHDSARGWGCLAKPHWVAETGQSCLPTTQSKPLPFLTMPTSCALPFDVHVEGVSWPTRANPAGVSLSAEGQNEYSLRDSLGDSLGITACNQLPFDPSIEIAPDVQEASVPTGLKADVHVPQEVSENGGGVSSSAVRNIDVTLPEGVTVSPSGANGLEACSEAQAGFEGTDPATGADLFSAGAVLCPSASKIATVKIKVPIIEHPLEGSVYLAAQNANPFGSLVAMYLVAEDPFSGVRVKLAGEVSLNQQTGQITTSFRNSPQAPLEDAEFHFFGGERAPLATPPFCGRYTTNASFGPWSGEASVSSSSTFEINSGPHGAPCPSALPFAPVLDAGTTNIDAGAFTPLTTSISREDGNQNIQTVQLHMPAGISGVLTGVKLCGEAEANAGTCSQESLIGHTVVSVGLGGDPYSVTGGEVFLTGGYEGAPFGLSIVNPAKAGPFDLGKVVVRAKIELDPHTAQLTITTGTIPHILDGIPLQIKNVAVTIDRPGFTFNPTNCSRTAITGSIGSVEGASAPVSIPFEVANCATLHFAPKFSVSTSGKTSKANGASLTAKLSYPTALQGTQTNITRVKVDLPKQLPSRLTTLQKACLAAVFEANPANCPAASIVGHATVTTPLLPVPLTGPAYFVSHGGEAFPSLTMVLQGYGVTIDLIGSTFIRKGITSNTFQTVPDVPFNKFELTLPEGKYSALTANGNLCKSTLTMPTAFYAQNGAEIHQNTKITTTNCPKTKKPKKQHKTKHTHNNKKSKK